MAVVTQTIQDQVTELYLGFFGRAPDAAGFGYWTQEIAAGAKTPSQIADAFAHTPEFISTYGGKTPIQQVTAIYNNVLDRAPDAEGLAYWVNELNTGTSIGTVVWQVVNAAFQQVGTADGLLVQNKVKVGEYFAITLASNDTAAAASAYNLVTSDPASVAIAEASLVSTTISLTTNIDNIQIRQPAAQILGVAGGFTPTWNPGDNISGNGFANLDLKVTNVDVGYYNRAGDYLNALPVGGWDITAEGQPTVSGVQTATFSSQVFNPVLVTFDTTNGNYGGLTQLNLNNSGSDYVNVAATTSVTINNTGYWGPGANGGAVDVLGGNNVTVNAKGSSVSIGGEAGVVNSPVGTVVVNQTWAGANTIEVDGGSSVLVNSTGINVGVLDVEPDFITIGDHVATTGTVTVNASALAIGGGETSVIGAINVTGGSVVTITETAGSVAQANGKVNDTNVMGSVTVNGTDVTTTVTVNQSAATLGAAIGAAAVTGIATVDPVVAAPGVNGVTAVDGRDNAAAVVSQVGVTTGVVTVIDGNFDVEAADTISTVTLSNFAGAEISSDALTTLNLSGTTGANGLGGTVNVYTATTKSATMALNLTNLGGTMVNGGTTKYYANLVDANGAYSTANINVTGNNYVTFGAPKLANINVAGTGTFNIMAGPNTAFSVPAVAIAISGAAGFNDGSEGLLGIGGIDSFAGAGINATLTTTSSGTITATLDATKQSFAGSTGRDVITINAAQGSTTVLQSIAGGTALDDELVLAGGTYAMTTAQLAKISGFEQIGVGASLSGTVDSSKLTVGGATKVRFLGGNQDAVTVTGVAKGADIVIESSLNAASVQYADTTAGSDVANVILGKATNNTDIQISNLAVQDSWGLGVNTLNFVSNNSAYGNGPFAAPQNTITTLDTSTTSVINVTGNAGLAIDAILGVTAVPGQASIPTSFTLTNNTVNNGTVVEVGSYASNGNLKTINLGGTGATAIHELTGNVTTLTINNTGTGTAVVGDAIDGDANVGFLFGNNTLTSLTINGQVQIGANVQTAANAIGATTGVTISAAANNAHMNITLNGAAAGKVDNIVVGNGNNFISDNSTNGTVNITTGTGYNIVDVSAIEGNDQTEGATYFANVTLGSNVTSALKGLFDVVAVSTLGATVNQYNTTITGANQGDMVVMSSLAADSTISKVTGVFNNVTDAIEAAWLATTTGAPTDAAYVQFGGNTYVVANAGDAAAEATDTAIQLIGLHTLDIGTFENSTTIVLLS